MAKIFGQLERAQLEVLGADPSGAGLVTGRAWFNSSSNRAKYYNGTSVLQIASTSAADADAIAAAMSSTGTGSIVATASAANANTLIEKRTRSTGSTVGVGGIAVSERTSNPYSTTSTSPVVVTDYLAAPMTVTITTSGRPVFVALVASSEGSTSGSYIDCRRGSAGTAEGWIYLLNAGAGTGGTWNIRNNTSSASGIISRFGTSLSFIDIVSAGTHTYELQAQVFGGSDTLDISLMKIVAFEL